MQNENMTGHLQLSEPSFASKNNLENILVTQINWPKH